MSKGILQPTQVRVLDSDGALGETQWKIHLMLDNVDADSVPVGSVVFSSTEVKLSVAREIRK